MEMVYHYLWKHRLLERVLTGTRGERVEVVNPGFHNLDAGPDFLGARVKVDDEEWVGNVEIHVKASDWFVHHHDSDPAYSNVILHVVGMSDTEITDSHHDFIPQVVASFPPSFVSLYSRLSEKISEVECEGSLSGLSSLVITDWIETLSVERMQRKATAVQDILNYTEGDWERTCFIMLARSLGFSLNSDPFEMLARSLTLNILARHSDDLMQLEALLFGQSGMLDQSNHIFDEYYQLLCREYGFLARKYGLRPMRADLWKFSKTRPGNFPTRRIALLARSVYGGFSLLSRLLKRDFNLEKGFEIFDWKLDGYWERMLDFDKPAGRLSPKLTPDKRNLLLINFVAPMLYAYGASHSDPDLAERGLEIWRMLEAEDNRIVKRWERAGIKAGNAAESQALIQLRKEYCDRNRCLDCRFGHKLLRNSYCYNTERTP